MNTLKVQAKNVGLVRKANLEFIPGLNVIQGPSSSGKSTILNAIISTIFNDPGDHQVTKGETVSALAIEYNGHRVIRKKDLSAKEYKTVYSVDGKAYGKMGRAPLQQVLDALGFHEIKTTDSKVRVNFSSQFSTPFLVDETPSRIFEFMTTTDDAVNLSGILHDMRSDYDEIVVDKRTAEATVNALKKTVARESAIACKLDAFTQVMDQVLGDKGMFENLDSLLALVSHTETALSVARSAQQNAKKVKSLYENTDTTKLGAVMDQLGPLSTQCAQAYAIKKKAEQESLELTVVKEQLVRLENVPSPDRVVQLQSEVTELSSRVDEAGKHLDEGRRISSWLKKAGQVDSVSDPGEALKKLEKLNNIISGIETFKDAKADYDANSSSVQGELEFLEREMSTFDVCPLCGQTLPHEHTQTAESEVL